MNPTHTNNKHSLTGVEVVLFDLDGTLLDSDAQTLFCLQKVFKEFGYPVPTEKDFVACAGLTIFGIFEKLLKRKDYQNELKVYQGYLKETFDMQHWIRGAEEVLMALQDRGYTMGLVTNRARMGVEWALDHFSLQRFFEVVVDRESTEQHKPSPVPLQMAMNELGVASEQCVYVGDTEIDVQAARHAGVVSILFTSKQDHYGADYVVHKPGEVLKILGKRTSVQRDINGV